MYSELDYRLQSHAQNFAPISDGPPRLLYSPQCFQGPKHPTCNRGKLRKASVSSVMATIRQIVLHHTLIRSTFYQKGDSIKILLSLPCSLLEPNMIEELSMALGLNFKEVFWELEGMMVDQLVYILVY